MPRGRVLEDDRRAKQRTCVRKRCGRRSSATREPLGPCSFAVVSCCRLLPAGLLGGVPEWRAKQREDRMRVRPRVERSAVCDTGE